jgi:hypothetical protein
MCATLGSSASAKGPETVEKVGNMMWNSRSAAFPESQKTETIDWLRLSLSQLIRVRQVTPFSRCT